MSKKHVAITSHPANDPIHPLFSEGLDQEKPRLYNTHAYPDIYDPQCPYPLFKLKPLFEPGQLEDAQGNPVSFDDLIGKSVALYFGDFSKLKCKSLLAHLLQTYKVANESGDCQKMEIIFVSLDATEEQYKRHRQMMPWVAVKWNSPVIQTLKKHFRVFDITEASLYGFGPRHDVPALIVVGKDGRMLQNLDAINQGYQITRKWDLTATKFL